MSRFWDSGDDSEMPLALWRQAIENALSGRKGQATLRELEAALLALPQKRLIEGALCHDGEVCALGALALKRGAIDPENPPYLEDGGAAEVGDWAEHHLGVRYALAWEIQWHNDEGQWQGDYLRRGRAETPEERYERVLAWVRSRIKAEAA